MYTRAKAVSQYAVHVGATFNHTEDYSKLHGSGTDFQGGARGLCTPHSQVGAHGGIPK